MLKRALRVKDKVKHYKKGIGPVYNGCKHFIVDGRPCAYVGSSTYAGKVIKGSKHVWVCNKLAGTHRGLCSKGYTVTGSPRIWLT